MKFLCLVAAHCPMLAARCSCCCRCGFSSLCPHCSWRSPLWRCAVATTHLKNFQMSLTYAILAVLYCGNGHHYYYCTYVHMYLHTYVQIYIHMVIALRCLAVLTTHTYLHMYACNISWLMASLLCFGTHT